MLTKESTTMTAEEKMLKSIRNYLIEENGEEFLKLSEEQQTELIIAVLREFIEKTKNEK